MVVGLDEVLVVECVVLCVDVVEGVDEVVLVVVGASQVEVGASQVVVGVHFQVDDDVVVWVVWVVVL